jgi:glycosyltransferase involved in cell wall biosynthesis
MNVARYMNAQGHEVTTVSMHPEKTTEEVDATGRRILHRPYWIPLLARLHVEPTHTFFFPAWRSLRRLDPDVVHSFFYTDALAAARARGARRYRVLFQMNGIAIPGVSCRRFPPEAWIWRRALAAVDERIACSEFVAAQVREHYGRDCLVLTPPVDVDEFPMGPGPADDRPTILSVADFTVPRKGARVLVRAFAIVKSKVKDARLRLSGRVGAPLQAELLRDLPAAVRDDVEVLGLGRPGEVPAQYREASVMALAAMWEPSGGVLLEALASGTPVVAPRHGGLPEFVEDGVGFLFDPRTDQQETTNAEGLAEALLAGIELSRQSGVRERCRKHAERFSTERMGAALERLYAGA